MLSDEELLTFNSLGYIPGPLETEEAFLSRVKILKEQKFDEFLKCEEKIPSQHFSAAKEFTQRLYDFTLEDVFCFYANKGLPLWQGAALWLYEDPKKISFPVIQLKKGFKKGSYLFYSREEVMAHEMTHAARLAFQEPRFEEILAYQSSSNLFRRFLGPIFQASWESFMFVFFALLFNLCNGLKQGFSYSYLAQWGCYLSLGWFVFLLARLVFSYGIFFLALYKIGKTIKNPKYAKAALLRLTDKEIAMVACSDYRAIDLYFKNEKEKNLRLKMVFLAYF